MESKRVARQSFGRAMPVGEERRRRKKKKKEDEQNRIFKFGFSDLLKVSGTLE